MKRCVVPAAIEMTSARAIAGPRAAERGGHLLRLDAEQHVRGLRGPPRRWPRPRLIAELLCEQCAPLRADVRGDDLVGAEQPAREDAAGNRLGHVPRPDDAARSS